MFVLFMSAFVLLILTLLSVHSRLTYKFGDTLCCIYVSIYIYSVGIYLFKINNGKTGTVCKICSKLRLIHPNDVRHLSGVFIATFEQISHIVLMFSLLTLNK